MNATGLFYENGKPSGAFFCGKCRIIHHDQVGAEKCCKPNICECGAECQPYWLICDRCRHKRDIAQEKERFEKAEKLTSWDGAVYCEGLGYNEGYFQDVGELEDFLDDEADNPEFQRPEYVWTCDDHHFCQLDYDRIIEDATQDEAYEDWDAGSIEGEKEFRAAIDAIHGCLPRPTDRRLPKLSRSATSIFSS